MNLFDIATKNVRLKELEDMTNEADFWSDSSKSSVVLKEIKILKDKLDKYKKVSTLHDDTLVLIDLGNEENDEKTVSEVKQNIKELTKEIEKLEIENLLAGKNDQNNAIITIHPGAGGTEAQDWAEMLYRMYFRYANIQGYDVKLIDSLPGTGAGYKSVTMMISGTHAYGNLINEKGVHRLVRISPFDANKRRHTSFASVDVSPVIDDDEPIEIKADELKIDTYRAGGAGGQHVNKTESAVRITHLPTGIVVQCQNERSQLQNKEFAMKMLSSKLAQLKQEKLDEEKAKEKSLDKKIEWGSQIRSYVLHPYNMVKDHRTNHQTSNTTAVLDGAIQDFIVANLVEKNN